jgi:Tfp pilus assembly protein PilF
MNRIEKLKQMLITSPEDSFLLHALALEQVKIGDDAQARQLFEQLLAKNPDYVGSYYHLAALQARQNDVPAAIATYETGMEKAKAAGDQHALNELRSAYEEMIY